MIRFIFAHAALLWIQSEHEPVMGKWLEETLISEWYDAYAEYERNYG